MEALHTINDNNKDYSVMDNRSVYSFIIYVENLRFPHLWPLASITLERNKSVMLRLLFLSSIRQEKSMKNLRCGKPERAQAHGTSPCLLAYLFVIYDT